MQTSMIRKYVAEGAELTARFKAYLDDPRTRLGTAGEAANSLLFNFITSLITIRLTWSMMLLLDDDLGVRSGRPAQADSPQNGYAKDREDDATTAPELRVLLRDSRLYAERVERLCRLSLVGKID